MLPVSYYEPDGFECDCEDHDEGCSFCYFPIQHCDCYGDD